MGLHLNCRIRSLQSIHNQRRALEALADPNCGWFYRRDADSFKQIPGNPIAYWASDAFADSFATGASIGMLGDHTGSQLKTGDNGKYIRFVWEVNCDSVGKERKWVPCAKGGEYRRWYGNLSNIVNMGNGAIAFYQTNSTSNLLAKKYWYAKGIAYTKISSGISNFRYYPAIGVFETAGPVISHLGDNLYSILGLLNSSVATEMLSIMNPTLNMQAKDIKALPVAPTVLERNDISDLAHESTLLSKADYDSFETSWDFKRNPLV